MAGPVDWAILSLVVGTLLAAVGFSWVAFRYLGRLEIRVELLEKDMRHTKAAVAQHAKITSEMVLDVDRLKKPSSRR